MIKIVMFFFLKLVGVNLYVCDVYVFSNLVFYMV